MCNTQVTYEQLYAARSVAKISDLVEYPIEIFNIYRPVK